ncbi:lipase/acyltransferase domain-containing protein [Laspinema olomoucense]|uniref:lipase/acyltransferase domain-containing protein n=1 Tax=Laspinema olomoucense TaxID=3231600 RepID=UPI0021BADDE8|nr:lecithin--cholesterol acyltransferase [Laspinema sp. D3a]MCT7991053.1 lecithin--cholesterol acyltransferase [Laspinema sp. D3a]
MSPIDFKDMIVLLPGITGSVLQKNGRDVWAISGQSFWNAVKSPESLVLEQDDPEQDDLEDGIIATRVMQDFYMVPGLAKVIDGYTKLRELLLSGKFRIYPQSPENPDLVNYYEFPYDWRRDNRVSARKLKRFIDEKLHKWRQESGYEDAQVILLAHSMGGLVSRYYLEVLGGWRDCKALFTFGTPYRGSVSAILSLLDGYKKAFLDLTEALRSFTSVYQLLPVYPMLQTANGCCRLAEVDALPELDLGRAIAARAFHEEIRIAAEANRQDKDWQTHGYVLVPFVGTGQVTYQSATLLNGKLEVSNTVPSTIPDYLGNGDDTVPRVSAIPLEMANMGYYNTFIPEHHGSLQANKAVLEQIEQRLIQMQFDSSAIRGPEQVPSDSEPVTLSLEIDDFYLPGEPVEIRATIRNGGDSGGKMVALIHSKTSKTPPISVPLKENGYHCTATLENLPPGTYEIEVNTESGVEAQSVRDVFEIAA